MAAFLIYILKSALILALLVSLFMLFMSRETFHRINRYVMLGIVWLALILPAVNIGIESPFQGVADAVIEYFTAEEPSPGADIVGAMPVVVVEMEQAQFLDLSVNKADNEKPFDWLFIVTAAYSVGVVLLVVRQLVMYIQVVLLIARGRVVDASLYGHDGIRLCVHSGKEKPFSWFCWVVVSEDDLSDGGREILTHEAAHVHACHSWDILFADAVIILQWFNPLAWIMKNCFKDIHEFEADEAVIESGVNARQYQLLIIKKAVGARLYSIANSFNHSLTKKRITMMCKEKSKKWRCAKALYIVPVAAIAALSFSTVEATNPHSGKDNEFVANDTICDVDSVSKSTPKLSDDNSGVYQIVEVMPEFPGGMGEMMNFLFRNINYPAEAREAGKQGRAVVGFIVNIDGTISNAEIVKSAGDASLDAESVRVVESMPKWKPGMQGGKAVKTRLNLPVYFKLQEPAKPVSENGKNEPALVELGSDGGIFVSNPDNLVVVINGVLYEGELQDIETENIESVTVVPIEKLTGEELEKCKALGKKGVLYITRKYKFNNLGDGEAVFAVCEQQPVFPGGEGELLKWLSGNIRYPKISRDVNAEGKVYVSFVVKADGTITDVKAIHSEYSSKNAKVSDAMNLEAHLLRCQAVLNTQENELRGFENDIAEWKKESKALEESGASADVLKFRNEELEKALLALENSKKRVAQTRIDLEEAHKKLVVAKNELSGIEVTAYKNSKGEPVTGEELLELEKTAHIALCYEAERVVKSMPKWQPGMQGGKPVNVQFTIPISFYLQ